MGAFHEGHLQLMRLAKEKGRCVVSLFVNPTQFAPNEDLSRYPRPLERDLDLARSVGVDVLFRPSVETMYPRPGISVAVPENPPLWEMRFRPGHFSGVATVVLKLFNMVRPDCAIFGWKDLQQCWVIRRMVEDLDVPVTLQFAETTREPDGLAMSSRNAYLSAPQRALAPTLYRILNGLAQEVSQTPGLAREAEQRYANTLEEAGFRVDYLAWVRMSDLQRATTSEEPTACIVAARLGTTRLIDNVRL
jgi:pantoate--beta-alanine ligase